MPDILPKTRKPILRINPSISLFYGPPKTGKTEEVAKLEDALVLATEDGIEMYEANYLRITTISGGTTYYDKDHQLSGEIKTTSLNNFFVMMNAEAARQKSSGEVLKFPYKYLIVDTLDELESMAEVSATVRYKGTIIGKSFTGGSVIELPQGSGYYWLRMELLDLVDKLKMYCKYLILISHVKDKLLDKGGVTVEVRDISLTGKLGQIIAAKCDVIGYVYREPGKPKMVSFETYENSTMGARFPRLAGKKMEFKFENIFLPE